MARPLRQSTAVVVIVGPCLDATDGKTPETSLTVSGIDIDLYKAGATGVSTAVSATASGGDNDMVHAANGYYSLEFTAGNTDTLGPLLLSLNDSAMLPVWHEFEVLPANVYDALYGSDRLQVDVAEISGDATAADNLEAAADGTGYNLGGGAVVAASVTGAVGSVTGNVGGNVGGSVGSISGVTFPANFAALGINASGHVSRVTLADTVTTLTNAPADSSGTTTLLSRLTSTRAGYLDNLSAGAVATAAALAVADAILDKLDTALELDGSVYRFTTNALEQAPSGGGGGATAEEVWTYATRVLTANTNLNDPTAAAVATAVRSELTTELGRIDVASSTLATGANLAAVKADTAAILDDTGTTGVVVASGSKAGYSLASTGLDAISVTPPTGVATTFPQMVVQTWRRFFRRATKSATQIITYADDGTTPVTTQAISASGSDETQGAAS